VSKTLLAAIAAVTITFSAHAADIPDDNGPMLIAPQVFSWDGIYFGANAGYLWGDSQVYDFSSRSGTFGKDGFIFGVQGGVNYQTGAWVWGAEADLQYSNAEGSTLSGCACATDLRWYGTVRGRAGYAFDQALIYMTAGLAYGGTKTTDVPSSFSKNKFGWIAGAGLEFAYTRKWSARAEYLYMDLGNAETSSLPLGGKYSSNHIVRMGVNYHFK
jgi:outer membrane immunogenic protein